MDGQESRCRDVGIFRGRFKSFFNHNQYSLMKHVILRYPNDDHCFMVSSI